MTREEIIKGLNAVNKECGWHLNESFAWMAEIFEAAISELEQESKTEGKDTDVPTKDEPKTEKVIKMREATSEERESIDKYIKSISKSTGVHFWDLKQEPKTGHWIDLNELEEGISRGCEFAGTQEVVHDTFLDCINELSGVGDWDEMTTIDLNDKEIVLQDLMERFYDKIARNIYNYATTCCREG